MASSNPLGSCDGDNLFEIAPGRDKPFGFAR
jgi:hypothetical protein